MNWWCLECGSSNEYYSKNCTSIECNNDINKLSKKIIFVGQNPSVKNLDANIPFIGTKSYITLQEWIKNIGLNLNEITFLNVSSKVGKITVKDYELDHLKNSINKDQSIVIALGNVASDALKRIDINHYRMPHPSNLNRKLNDGKYLEKCIQECKEFIQLYNK